MRSNSLEVKNHWQIAHEYSSWERGLNEYTNGLIRLYMPKKEEFKKYSDNDIEDFQKKSIEDQEKNLILSHQKIDFFH